VSKGSIIGIVVLVALVGLGLAERNRRARMKDHMPAKAVAAAPVAAKPAVAKPGATVAPAAPAAKALAARATASPAAAAPQRGAPHVRTRWTQAALQRACNAGNCGACLYLAPPKPPAPGTMPAPLPACGKQRGTGTAPSGPAPVPMPVFVGPSQGATRQSASTP
jgi:hypothetical protein